MIYRTVGNKCAIDICSFKLLISNEVAIAILVSKGFQIIEIDIAGWARKQINKSKFKTGATFKEAPQYVGCSSFVKWVFAQNGIWLPRRVIQQREFGYTVTEKDLKVGDLVFRVGRKYNYYLNNPDNQVGHVGIITTPNMVVHATNKLGGIKETPLDSTFIKNEKFRGIRRIYSSTTQIVKIPMGYDVETSDDLKWVILESL